METILGPFFNWSVKAVFLVMLLVLFARIIIRAHFRDNRQPLLEDMMAREHIRLLNNATGKALTVLVGGEIIMFCLLAAYLGLQLAELKTLFTLFIYLLSPLIAIGASVGFVASLVLLSLRKDTILEEPQVVNHTVDAETQM